MEEDNIIETEIKEKEIKNPKKKSNIFWIILCIVIGLVSGLAGAGLAFAIRGNTHTNGDVIYQSVVLTDQNGQEVEVMSVQDIVENVKNSVVEIQTSVTKTNIFLQQFVSSGAGSGVILSKDGLIVTNHHVIEEADTIKVRLNNGEEYDATLIASDTQSDLVVLRISADNLQPAVVGDSSTLKVGEDVVAIGNPLGSLGGTVTEGILSALDREITIDDQKMTLLQTSAAINPGNSGGGLFNAKGELIGIVNAKSSGSGIEGLGFAIPVNEMKSVVEDLVETGKVQGRLALGIRYYEISSVQQAMRHGVNTLGLLVSEVEANSNADRAGIQANDIIVEVDGEQITTKEDLTSILNNHKVGDNMDITVVRNKEYVNLSVILQ